MQIFASPSPYQCRIVYCWSCPFSIQRISSGNFYDVYWLYDVWLLLVLCTIICHTFEFQAYLRLLCSCLFCLFIVNILQSVLFCQFFPIQKISSWNSSKYVAMCNLDAYSLLPNKRECLFIGNILLFQKRKAVWPLPFWNNKVFVIKARVCPFIRQVRVVLYVWFMSFGQSVDWRI